MQPARPARQFLLLLAPALLGVLTLSAQPAPDSARTEPTAPPASEARAERVIVTGNAAADNLDRANAARLDAMRQAIQQVGGAQVRSHEAARFGELVAKFTYVRATALVTSIREAGPAVVADGVYRQPFSVEVLNEELNRALVKDKIDVQLLYDLVQRPRILVAVQDEWNPTGDPAAAPVIDSDQASRQLIIAGFKERHPDFVFKEPRLLREGTGGAEALIEEAKRNQFDILILGATQSKLVSAPVHATPVEDRGMTANGLPDSQAKLARIMPARPAARAQFDVAVDWRVVNVSSAETLFVIGGARSPTDEDPPEFSAAKRTAKQALIRTKTDELFRELLFSWNQRAFSETYELLFNTPGLTDARTLSTRLENAGFVPGSVRLQESSPGLFLYTATANLGAEEIRDNLARVFAPELRIAASRRGRFEFEPVASTTLRTVAVTLIGLSLTDVRTLQAALERQAGVNRVQRQPVTAGRVSLQLATTLDDDDLGLAVEAALPGRVRVTEQTATGIVADAITASPTELPPKSVTVAKP